MPLKERQQLIKALEEKRGSRIICYVTGDRQPQLETKIGMDVFPFFYDLCSRLGSCSWSTHSYIRHKFQPARVGGRSHDTIKDRRQPDNQMDFRDTLGACCRLHVLPEISSDWF